MASSNSCLKFAVIRFDALVPIQIPKQLIRDSNVALRSFGHMGIGEPQYMNLNTNCGQTGKQILHDISKYDFVVLTYNANEEIQLGNEDSTYQIIKKTGGHIKVIFVVTNEKHVLGNGKIASKDCNIGQQLSPEEMDGTVGLLLTFDNMPKKKHGKALAKFIMGVNNSKVIIVRTLTHFKEETAPYQLLQGVMHALQRDNQHLFFKQSDNSNEGENDIIVWLVDINDFQSIENGSTIDVDLMHFYRRIIMNSAKPTGNEAFTVVLSLEDSKGNSIRQRIATETSASVDVQGLVMRMGLSRSIDLIISLSINRENQTLTEEATEHSVNMINKEINHKWPKESCHHPVSEESSSDEEDISANRSVTTTKKVLRQGQPGRSFNRTIVDNEPNSKSMPNGNSRDGLNLIDPGGKIVVQELRAAYPDAEVIEIITLNKGKLTSSVHSEIGLRNEDCLRKDFKKIEKKHKGKNGYLITYKIKDEVRTHFSENKYYK